MSKLFVEKDDYVVVFTVRDRVGTSFVDMLFDVYHKGSRVYEHRHTWTSNCFILDKRSSYESTTNLVETWTEYLIEQADRQKETLLDIPW